MFRALLALHQRAQICIKQLLNFAGLNCNNWITLHGMENVQLVGHMILSGDEMGPLIEELIDEIKMVYFDYLVIAIISLGPWLYGPLRASLIADAHFSLSTACCRRVLKHTYTVEFVGRDSVVGIPTTLRARGSGDRIPLEARFCPHVQTDPRAHSASCVGGTGSLSCGSSRQGVSLTTLPHLWPRLKKK
jgi:hypothetical protein